MISDGGFSKGNSTQNIKLSFESPSHWMNGDMDQMDKAFTINSLSSLPRLEYLVSLTPYSEALFELYPHPKDGFEKFKSEIY